MLTFAISRKDLFIKKPSEVHYHAGFLVFVDGVKQDFSELKYMKIEPCGTEAKEDEQLEKAHLHDGVGDVVHVHRSGSKWNDLFKNIDFPIDSSKISEAYLNGNKIGNPLDLAIKPYDNLTLVFGATDKDFSKEFVTKEHIQEVEERSENCGS